MSIDETIPVFLEELQIPFESIQHPPVNSCEDSMHHRSVAGWQGIGSKCIVLHAKGVFYLVVTRADRDIKGRLFKKPFGTKNIRFATEEEVTRATGCRPGSVPPFGVADPGLTIFVDETIFEAEHFMFNPADPTQSIRLRTEDLHTIYDAIPNPVVFFLPDADGRLLFRPRS